MTKLLINSKKSDTAKLSKIILFCSDNNEETRHVVATLKKEELKIKFFHYFKNEGNSQKYFIYSFNKINTNKFIEILGTKKDFLNNLKTKFHTFSACQDLIEFADKNSIKYTKKSDEIMYDFGDIISFLPIHYDENHKLIVPEFYTHPENGICRIYTGSKNLLFEINYKNNVKNGFMREFYPDGKSISLEQNYTDDKLDGISKGFYKSGIIEREESFVMGVKIGAEKYFDSNGVLKYETMFASNKKNGCCRKFFKNGQIEIEFIYKDDKRNGYARSFYNNGKLSYVANFKNGLRDGYTIEYCEKDGSINSKTLFRKGKMIDHYTTEGIIWENSENKNCECENEDKNQKPETENKPKVEKKKNLGGYDFSLINTETELEDLTNKIKKTKKFDFSLLLYGEPGSGKSEYAKKIAQELNLPVVTKKASEILSRWVGEAEENIADIFKKAEEDGAMLIFDEADSLLNSRTHAQRNWEITLVNEMLTWMETYPYPFVCTTNFMDTLDEASLRRFTFKIKFKYMTEKQIATAYESFFNFKADNKALKIKGLTVGDFVTVKKKAEFLGVTDLKGLTKMLEEEVKVKKSKELSTNVGFN